MCSWSERPTCLDSAEHGLVGRPGLAAADRDDEDLERAEVRVIEPVGPLPQDRLTRADGT